MKEFSYIGNELEVFAHAANWKRYSQSRLRPYLRGDVLEVGAGIGANTGLLRDAAQGRWVCLEPDRNLARQIDAAKHRCEVRIGTTTDLGADEHFDATLYLDVIEHIEDDRSEILRASRHLRPGGHVLVLSPAHQWLFTPFDEAIGHFRRYTRESLGAAAPPDLERVRLEYLDSAGLLASAANRLFLKSAHPKLSQILFWDRVLVPLSQVADPLFARRVGKSVLAVWRKRVGS